MARKIMMVGPSGIGKTTLAKHLSTVLNIPFVSGSYSDLVPETKDMLHIDMINEDINEIQRKDYQLINARHKAYIEHNSFISDRSYVDAMAYSIEKLSSKIEKCDLDLFLDTCKTLLFKECTHLIFMPFTAYVMCAWGEIEDNNKRITNPWYQWKISMIMMGIIRDMSMGAYSRKFSIPKPNGQMLKVLRLENIGLNTRFNQVIDFLNEK